MLKSKFNYIKLNLKKFSTSSINNNLNYDQIGHYLAGFIEGDGSIITPSSLKTDSGKNKVCYFQIVFHKQELEFIKCLQKRIGYGNIFETKENNVIRLMVQNLEGVLHIINLINGKMRTPKINALYTMIDWLNTHKLENKIIKQPLDLSPIDSNSWLAGFIDTDGSFSIKGFTSSDKTYPGFQFYLCQREIDKSGESFGSLFQIIADFLKVSLKLRIVNGSSQYNITTSNKISNTILIDYLTTYSLFTSKHLNYLDWRYALDLFYRKEHKNPTVYEQIKLLKSNMNDNREEFTWEHLDKFY